jgi:hypothetical protein
MVYYQVVIVHGHLFAKVNLAMTFGLTHETTFNIYPRKFLY